MNIILGIVVGVVIGWAASMIADAGGREALMRNVALGIVGAFVGGWLFDSMLEPADQVAVTFGAVCAALIGAAALLLIVNRIFRA